MIMQIARTSQELRQSNMELLRIVAMVLIVVYHTVYYILYSYRGDSPIFASLMTLLHIGVPLFVLISGYFGINTSVKGFLKLYLVLLFYNLLFYIIQCSLGNAQFAYKTFAKLWLPFSVGSWYWFFKVYIMLYLLAPIINIVRDRIELRNKLLVISGFITFYWGWFAQHPSLFDGKNVINFIFLYILGHWLRTRIVEREAKRKNERLLYIVSYLVVAGCIGVALYFSNERMQDLIKRICYGYNSPVLILMSVLFFLIFTTYNFKSKVVNWIAGSVIAVYCVHESQYFFRNAWYSFFEKQYLTKPLFPIIWIGSCLLLFVVSILFDKIREFIMHPIIKPLESLIQKSVGLFKGKTKIILKK